MADISKIKTLDGTTYDIKDTTARATGKVSGVKGNSESSYRTGNVNLTSDNIGAIPASVAGNTQKLIRPDQLNGCGDVTLDTKINTLRANRLAFLPADQIIIEKTTDGGSTWADAGVADSTKTGLFSETRAGVAIPQIDGSQNINCGLRITFTAMKYNVPAGTAETQKYNYWNSNYIVSTERYNQLKEMYFWVSTSNNSMSIKIERATGANSTSWISLYDSSNKSYGLTGWSGNDYVRFAQGVFGGGTTQTGNYWNYRITLFTRGTNGSTTLNTGYLNQSQSVMEIRGYGDTWWTAGNEYAANDKMYTHDYQKNVTFPAKVTATSFSGNLTGNSTGVSTTGSATNSTARHVWFSDSSDETKRAYSDNLKYTPSTNTISANVSGTVNGHTVNADVPSGAKFTDTTYTANTSKLVTTTVPNVTSVGSAPTLGTAIPADDITAWDAGSTPTLGTAIPADDITAWTTNTPTSFTVTGEKLIITPGTAASLSYTAKSIPNVTSVGSVPSLSYTAKSIPNVTSVGSAPTLGTAITVATGSLASNGGGGTVATGITAS